MNYSKIYALTELVMNYSYHEKLFDEDFICEAYSIIINGSPDKIMIEGKPQICDDVNDTNNRFYIAKSSYNPKTGKLIFSPQKMKQAYKIDLSFYKKININLLEYYIFMNINAIGDIIHELEHARQMRFMLFEENDLARLIRNVRAKKGDFNNDFYDYLRSIGYSHEKIEKISQQLNTDYHRNHNYFPTERAANVKSQSELLHLTDSISGIAHVERLHDLVYRKLHDILFLGYSFQEDRVIQTPIDIFMGIETILGDIYEKYSGKKITSSSIKKPTTSDGDIILYGGKINKEDIKRFIR